MRLIKEYSLLLALIPYISYADKCTLTVAKNSCWQPYQVTIYKFDMIARKKRKVLTIPKEKVKKTVKFTCQPKKKYKFLATLSPAIWQGDEHKLYETKKVWVSPAQLSKDPSWHVKLCFPKAFRHVPMPLVERPHACHCPKGFKG